jgi:hypothetical protein
MNKVRIVMLALQFLCSNTTAINPASPPVKRTLAARHIEHSLTLDILTVYNPEAGQCDGSPLVTASNQLISKIKLRSGSIRWMALSRDLLKRWGGHIHYGDTVNLSAGDPTVDGLWVVQDTMNSRFRKRGDLLFDANVRSTGKWSNVVVTLQMKKRRTLNDISSSSEPL